MADTRQQGFAHNHLVSTATLDIKERIFTGWYFETREGTLGPFETRDAAESCLRQLIDQNPSGRRDKYRQLGTALKQ
jgi:hypothetical protein